jgi:sirohydrochlorin ferrochelatase
MEIMRKRIVDARCPAIVRAVMAEPTPVIFLVDNGSLRPAATHSLRQWAERLEKAIGKPVWPVSLMHSDKVPASALDGLPAQTIDAGLREAASRGFGRILILPLFFGPSAALTTYLPRRIAAARQNRWGSDLHVSVAEPLDDGSASARDQLVALLEAGVLATRHEHALAEDTPVVLVDHGTPQPEVNAVRNRLAHGLGDRLGVPVRAASMERREGDAYAFNEPLLESAFDQPHFDRGPVIVSMPRRAGGGCRRNPRRGQGGPARRAAGYDSAGG